MLSARGPQNELSHISLISKEVLEQWEQRREDAGCMESILQPRDREAVCSTLLQSTKENVCQNRVVFEAET